MPITAAMWGWLVMERQKAVFKVQALFGHQCWQPLSFRAQPTLRKQLLPPLLRRRIHAPNVPRAAPPCCLWPPSVPDFPAAGHKSPAEASAATTPSMQLTQDNERRSRLCRVVLPCIRPQHCVEGRVHLHCRGRGSMCAGSADSRCQQRGHNACCAAGDHSGDGAKVWELRPRFDPMAIKKDSQQNAGAGTTR